MPSIIDEYQRQLRILDAMRSQSQAVRGRFDGARQRYLEQINASRSMGYMGDYVDQLHSRAREFSDQLDALLTFMINGELKIGEQEDRIQRLIRDAQTTQ